MKRFLILLILVLSLIASAPSLFLGFSIFHLGHAVEVATSLSAKLACSSRFITGLNKERISSDLSSYSPATKLVNIIIDDDNQQVTTDLFGLATTTAVYSKHYGCMITHPDADWQPKALQLANREKISNSKTNIISSQTTSNHSEQTQSPAEKAWPIGIKRPHLVEQHSELLENLLENDNKNGLNTRAIVIIKNGQLIAESYGPGFDKQTPLLGWSMAKSVIAMAIGRLEALNIELKSAPLFAEWSSDSRQEITVEHLLTMTSGLDFDETYAPGSDATHMLFTATSASDVAIASPLKHDVGSHFSYSSGTSNILARLLFEHFEQSPERTLSFIHESLFKPAGIKNITFEVDPSGVPVASSYIYATAPDWARLGWIMANKGMINGQQLLDEEWVTKATTPNSSQNDSRYGYQFWLNKSGKNKGSSINGQSEGSEELRWATLPEDAFAMMGNRKQFVMMVPSEQTVIVRLGWTKGDYPMESRVKTILESSKKQV